MPYTPPTLLGFKKVKATLAETNGDTPDVDALLPGHMRLFSYYKPSLEAGTYSVEATQEVKAKQYNHVLQLEEQHITIQNYITHTAPATKKTTTTPTYQKFEVVAPQFSIPADKINSYYPPDGHSDEGRILPHIVFNDPHFPWLRRAGKATNLSDAIDYDSSLVNNPKKPNEKGGFRNQVPWFAVIVFDPSELTITPDDAKALGLVDTSGKQTRGGYDPTKLPASGAYPMQASEYLTSINSRVFYEVVYDKPDQASDWTDLKESTEVTSVIFPTKKRVTELFGNEPKCDTLESYKYLAHVRQINTHGFPDAGVEDEGFFSICVSATIGDIETIVPKTMIAHLVSIEHLDSTISSATNGFGGSTADRIGLISLQSWTYTVIPEGPSFVDEMRNLAGTAQTLKPPVSVLQSLSDIANAPQPSDVDKIEKWATEKRAATRLHDRFQQGYTINRWRTPTGEETVALNRGPLAPIAVPQHPVDPADPTSDDWAGMSMHGKEFQIWDKECQMMNLTYSNAWNLGRLASISDGPFNAAVLRFRSQVWKWASSATRKTANGVPASTDLLATFPSVIRAIQNITPDSFEGGVSRINPAVKDNVAPALSHPQVAAIQARSIIAEVDANTSAGEDTYHAFATDPAANSDWVSIFNWIQDALYLAKIPMHYIFQEPSHIKGVLDQSVTPGTPALPPEALRFFHIDDAWIDCFIDGALSVANHLEPQFDRTRVRMKEVFNAYFKKPILNTDLTPVVPRSGLIIRSAVIKSTPDLRITASKGKWDDATDKWVEDGGPNDKTKHPIVRLTRLDDYTILCLFDCALAELWCIKLAQPPHQQRFAIASGIKGGNLTFEARQLFMKDAPADGVPWPPITINDPVVTGKFWDSKTRCIKPGAIAAKVNEINQGSKYSDKFPNSVEVGIELNDPAYELELEGPITAPKTRAEVPKAYLRQFWIKPGEDPLSDVIFKDETASNQSISPTTPALILLPPKDQDFKHPPLMSAPNLHTSRVISALSEASPASSPTPSTSASSVPGTTTAAPQERHSTARNLANLTHGNTRSVAVTAAAPAAARINGTGIATQQFQAMICVDYRPAPPMPIPFAGLGTTYAPFDYIPAHPDAILDLMIVIARKDSRGDPNILLKQIDIEIPVEDNRPPKDQNTKQPEPLLAAGQYVGHARMAGNLRFIPILYNNEDKPGASPILGVRLLPRSGSDDATIGIHNDGRTDDATVRLSLCRIADVKTPTGMSVMTRPSNPSKPRFGVVTVTMTERYKALNPDGTAKLNPDGTPQIKDIFPPTTITVLKKSVPTAKDVDTSNREVDLSRR